MPTPRAPKRCSPSSETSERDGSSEATAEPRVRIDVSFRWKRLAHAASPELQRRLALLVFQAVSRIESLRREPNVDHRNQQQRQHQRAREAADDHDTEALANLGSRHQA